MDSVLCHQKKLNISLFAIAVLLVEEMVMTKSTGRMGLSLTDFSLSDPPCSQFKGRQLGETQPPFNLTKEKHKPFPCLYAQIID